MVRRNAQARRVLELSWQEADRFGHRYLGPEHLVLGVLRDAGSAAARALRTHGVDLASARTALAELVGQGVVPGPRPSDADLLRLLGIDLEAVRRSTEQAFGQPALRNASRETTRARRRGVGRVPRSPLEDPPILAVRVLQLAGEQARTLGCAAVGPELLLLGVVKDVQTPWPRCMSNPWVRQLHASVGLPDGYRGAAGALLVALGVDLNKLRDSLLAELHAAVP
jgi:ATP-dependent Clp protease ATP-binding subunit ClpA